MGLQHLLGVVSKFCEWSRLQIKLDKSVITAFDYMAPHELDAEEFLCIGKPLVRLAADESFPYLGVRWSLMECKKRCALSLGLASEKDHIFSAVQDLVVMAKGHYAEEILCNPSTSR